MIKEFVDRWTSKIPDVKRRFSESHPADYDAIFKILCETLSDEDDSGTPDPKRITAIDHGSYQGTRVFVVGCHGYQPSTYWACCVDYGSCSGCDSFERIRGYDYDGAPTESQAAGYFQLCLNMLQGMREIGIGHVD